MLALGAASSGLSLPTAVLLGLLQGLTEFLPVSSSGHLVLAQALMGPDAAPPGILVEIVLHAGTLCAVLIVYRRDLWEMVCEAWRAARRRRTTVGSGARVAVEPRGLRAVALLALATLPVVIAGLLFADRIESAFEDPRFAGSMLLVTGGLLLATRWIRGRPGRALDVRVALAMGLMQVVSLMPGISRSGSTVVGGLFGGGRSAEVVRFSFLMSIPAIVGAVVFELPHLAADLSPSAWGALAAGFAAAVLTGWLAIRVLLRVVAGGRLHWFGLYCLLAGLLSLILLG